MSLTAEIVIFLLIQLNNKADFQHVESAASHDLFLLKTKVIIIIVFV